MNTIQKEINKILVQQLIAKGIIVKRGTHYFCMCAIGEEITTEIKEIFRGV